MITQDTIYELIINTQALEEANSSILASRGIFNIELQQVTGAIPLKTSFTSIEIQKDMIIIQGETENVFSVIEYATALEAEGIFSSVRIAELDEIITTPIGTEEDGEPLPQVNVITFEIVLKLPIPEQGDI